jgi:hypothetical protein
MGKTFLSRSRLPKAILVPLLILGQGCTQSIVVFEPLASDEAACLEWYQQFDEVLADYELDDPSAAKIPGFPYLRADRFLASFRLQPLSDPAYADWLERMRRLDAALRLTEAANLPPDRAKALPAAAPLPGTLEQALHQCGSRLVKAALRNPETRPLLRERTKVPDHYRTWQRIAGAYWIMQYPAKVALGRLHRNLAASFGRKLEDLPVQGRRIRYAPISNRFLRTGEIAGILREAYANPLGIPEPSEDNLQRLFEHFAPVWEIDTRNDTDKVGRVYLTGQGNPRVDTSEPVVYRQHAYTRFRGRSLLQLIYQVWLPAREKTGLADLFGGDLDSVIWRITLNPEGIPVAYDSIHACGCYYLLFPGSGYRSVAPKDGAEAVLSPKRIGAVPSGRRLLVRLEARTHYLQQIDIFPEIGHPAAIPYAVQSYEALLSLPLPDGSRRRLFAPDGIVAASVRPERFLLWPYGIPSPGAMRQSGVQAIAFTGRRHFDDPFLLENLIAEGRVKN